MTILVYFPSCGNFAETEDLAYLSQIKTFV